MLECLGLPTLLDRNGNFQTCSVQSFYYVAYCLTVLKNLTDSFRSVWQRYRRHHLRVGTLSAHHTLGNARQWSDTYALNLDLQTWFDCTLSVKLVFDVLEWFEFGIHCDCLANDWQIYKLFLFFFFIAVRKCDVDIYRKFEWLSTITFDCHSFSTFELVEQYSQIVSDSILEFRTTSKLINLVIDVIHVSDFLVHKSEQHTILNDNVNSYFMFCQFIKAISETADPVVLPNLKQQTFSYNCLLVSG